MSENKNIKDITGDPKKAVRKLAYPLVASMLLIMINNIIDSIWVAGLGPDPLAAIGFATPIFNVLIGIGVGVGAGVNSLISRYIGAKNLKQANNAVIHSLILSIIVTLVITALFVIYLDPILHLMGASDVLDYSRKYAFIITLCSFTILLPEIYAGIFRSEGAIKRATVPMAVAAILNMILDPIFIYTFNLGIEGAAIATIIGCAVQLAIMLYWMFIKRDTYFTYDLKDFKMNFTMYKEILNVGLPASLEEILMAIVSMVVNLIIVIVAGTTAVAVYTVGWRLLAIAIVPSIGVATATITVAGIAYGAKNYKNIQIANRYSVKIGLIFTLIIAVLFISFADQIAYIFSYSANSSQLSPQIADFLRLMWLYLLPVPFGATAGYIFQGLGKGKTSFILTTWRELICTIIFAYLFGITLDFGLLGVYWGLIIGTAVGSGMEQIYAEWYVKRLISLNEKKEN